ncbi:MAG: phosphopantetheine-binding protein [Oscillospiraceae bacterium]
MKKQFFEILCRVCGSSEPRDCLGLDLVETGLLDSLAIISLLDELEDAFGIVLSPTEVSPTVWHSANAILEEVRRRL